MRKLSTIDTIVAIIVGLVVLGGAGGGFYIHLNKVHASAKELTDTNARITLVEYNMQYAKDSNRYYFLEDWLDRKDKEYGDGCRRCDEDTRREYTRKKAEKTLLEKKL